MASRTFVIVGAGLAGAKAAETLRAEGFDGRILLVGDEPERPYERPPLSKAYLRGEAPREQAFVHDERFYADERIELRTGTPVVALDPAAHRVTLAADEELAYDALLLAPGSRARDLPVPGADLPGVHTLRTIADADRLAREIGAAGRVVVIGAGWIGCEVAASIRELGHDVAMVAPSRLPLRHALGDEIGAVYRDLHAEQGVALHLGLGVEALTGRDRVEDVRLTDGSVLAADLVVVGIGAVPRVELAAAAGLTVADGIVVDAYLRTDAPDVFAAGDVASAYHPLLGAHVRLEHWANALHQGPAAARAMLGTGAPYDRIPYFFSDQYDLGMEYSGYAPRWDQVVVRGDADARELVAFWVADGAVVAAMNANVWDVTDTLAELVRARVPGDADRLADVDTPLEALVPAP